MSIGYLEPVTDHGPVVALYRAVNGFRQREGEMPVWVIAGVGVQLPAEEVLRFGLRERVNGGARPGHILVGRETESD